MSKQWRPIWNTANLYLIKFWFGETCFSIKFMNFDSDRCVNVGKPGGIRRTSLPTKQPLRSCRGPYLATEWPAGKQREEPCHRHGTVRICEPHAVGEWQLFAEIALQSFVAWLVHSAWRHKWHTVTLRHNLSLQHAKISRAPQLKNAALNNRYLRAV